MLSWSQNSQGSLSLLSNMDTTNKLNTGNNKIFSVVCRLKNKIGTILFKSLYKMIHIGY